MRRHRTDSQAAVGAGARRGPSAASTWRRSVSLQVGAAALGAPGRATDWCALGERPPRAAARTRRAAPRAGVRNRSEPVGGRWCRWRWAWRSLCSGEARRRRGHRRWRVRSGSARLADGVSRAAAVARSWLRRRTSSPRRPRARRLSSRREQHPPGTAYVRGQGARADRRRRYPVGVHRGHLLHPPPGGVAGTADHAQDPALTLPFSRETSCRSAVSAGIVRTRHAVADRLPGPSTTRPRASSAARRPRPGGQSVRSRTTASASSRPRSVRTARPAACAAGLQQPAGDGVPGPRAAGGGERGQRQPLAQPQPEHDRLQRAVGVVEQLGVLGAGSPPAASRSA